MGNELQLAEEIARESHKGQKRWGGEPYITHPEAVVKTCKYIDCKIIAWLHDVLEDTDMQPEDLEERGIPRYLIQSVINLTRIEGESYKDYILKIKEDNVATLVKIQDLKHNLSNLKPGSMRDKYLLALYILEEVK